MEHRRLSALVAACMWSLANACVQDPSGSNAEARQSTPAGEATRSMTAGPEGPADSPSPQDLVVSWEHAQDPFQTEALTARVQNNADDSVLVRLEALMRDPTSNDERGALVGRILEERTLRGHETLPVALAVGRLPVQSVGVASTLVLVASYEVERPVVLGPSQVAVERQHRQVHATPLHVTFDADFARATFRSAAAQARASLSAATAASGSQREPLRGVADDAKADLAYEDGAFERLAAAFRSAPELVALRVYDPATDALRSVTVAAGTGADRPSSIPSVVDLPHDVLPSLSLLTRASEED